MGICRSCCPEERVNPDSLHDPHTCTKQYCTCHELQNDIPSLDTQAADRKHQMLLGKRDISKPTNDQVHNAASNELPPDAPKLYRGTGHYHSRSSSPSNIPPRKSRAQRKEEDLRYYTNEVLQQPQWK